MIVKFDKAESARTFRDTIEPHDDTFDFSAFREELVYLFLGRVEGQIAYVECGGFREVLCIRAS